MNLFSRVKRRYKEKLLSDQFSVFKAMIDCYSDIRRANRGKEFKEQFVAFKEKLQRSTRSDFQCDEKDLYPCLDDNTTTTGFDAHYLYHPAWAFRRVKEANPVKHVDISSYLCFSTLLSAVLPVEFYDYRPANIKLSGLVVGSTDLCNLHFENNSILSLSCMHTVEHVGLGRYGDPIDPDGDLKAMGELSRVLAPGGRLYFVTPVGKPRICFNAHRIYSYEQILSYFLNLSLVEFSMLPDNGKKSGMILNANPNLVSEQHYACGCFIFTKK